MVFKHKYIVGIEDIGRNQMATNKAIMALMEDVACLHSAKAGYGVMDIAIKKRVWVLLDWEVKIFKRPIYNQEIEAHTWAGETEKLTAKRYFELKDNNGQLQAAGISRWILMDLEKKRPVRLTEDIVSLYEPEPKRKVEGLELADIKELSLEQEQYTKQYNVLRRDIDINEHMHNLAYLEAAYEILPEEVFQNQDFNYIRMKFKKEIKYGEKVSCSYSCTEGKHTIIWRVKEETRAIVELQK